MQLHPDPQTGHVSQLRSACAEAGETVFQPDSDFYRDIAEHSEALLCVHDLQGRFLWMNPAPARNLGYSVEEMLQIPMRQFIAPEFHHLFDVYLTRIASEGEAEGLLALVTRSGERRMWQYHNSLRTEGVESPVVRGTAYDVTSKAQVKELLHGVGESLVARMSENERVIAELKLFRTLVDQSNDAIEVVDPQTLRFLDINDKSCSDLGYTREELLTMTVLDIDPAVTEASVAKAFEQLRRAGSLVMESVHRRKDGLTFPVEVSLRLVQLDREYIVVIVHDLTQRKLAESQLLASQERYRAVHDCSPLGICWVESRTGRFLGVNPKYCEILGRTEQELLQGNFQSVTHPDDLATNVEELLHMVEGKARHYEMEKRYLRPDGSVRWVELNMVAMWPEGDNPLWHMAIVQDITERKQAEQALRESEARERANSRELQIILDTVPVPVFIAHDVACRRITTNRAGYELLRLPTGSNVSKSAPDDENPAFRALRDGREISADQLPMQSSALSGNSVYGVPLTLEFENGAQVHTLFNAVPILNSEGKPTGVIGASIDITQSKLTEQALQNAKEFSENLIATANVMVLSLDTQGNVVLFNRAAEEITGYTFAELKGKNWSTIVPGDKFLDFWEEFDRLIAGTGGKNFENLIFTKNGEERYIAWSSNQVKVNGEVVGIISFGNDITERRRADEALRRSEQNYRNFVSQSSEGIFREELDMPVPIDLPEDEMIHHILHDTYIAECNDALARMYGVASSQEFVGKRLKEMVPPEDPRNIKLTRDYVRSGFHVLERESHEIDIHGNPKVFLNSMIGVVENGMLVRTWGIQRDVTEKVKLEEARRKAEAALREREQTQKLILDHLPVGVLLTTVNGEQAVYQNPRFIEIFGYSIDQFSSAENRFSLAYPDPAYRASVTQQWRERMAEAARTGKAIEPMEVTITCRDGSSKFVRIFARVIGDLNFITFSDLTKRRLAEEALRQSEQRFRVALSGSPIKVFNQDCDLRYTWVYNLPQGWRPQDYLGKTDAEVFDPETAARMAVMKRAVLESGKGTRQEFFLNDRGHTCYCDVTIEPLLDASGKVIGLNCACVDISHLRAITDELRQAKEKLSEEKLYLEKAIGTELGFGEIVGRSGALKDVMDQVAKVAPSDATVLLLGETGTGKELVARAVHQMSQRKDASFIKMNCAAIPSGLLESELFGHEKGAFTGAIAKKLGRLELADHGTLFLDEIGEIPLELQPKLLRVLQDQEFERLGATQTLKVNFRLIAATNRDLFASVAQHEFRSDLYYRLNVFPIRIPSLRDRREDIPMLVEHFVQKYATRMNRSITSIPSKTMEALVQWSWPGNIRELENFVERSVILTPGMVLQVPLFELQAEPAEHKKETLREVERERIVRALRECNGQLGGPNGAAARLGLKRTTLQSRLTHFAINPADYRA